MDRTGIHPKILHFKLEALIGQNMNILPQGKGSMFCVWEEGGT